MNSFQFFGGHLAWIVHQVRIESHGLEFEAFDADYVFAVKSLAARRAKPVFVFEEQVFDRCQRSIFLFFLYGLRISSKFEDLFVGLAGLGDFLRVFFTLLVPQGVKLELV